jgi:ABC-type multidrug transport system fused ATPase/permease subunit
LHDAQAWIQNKSVRNCILFDRPYNRHRYRKALKSAQLYADLQMLPSHDGTEIGERGINLSGGALIILEHTPSFSMLSMCLTDDLTY